MATKSERRKEKHKRKRQEKKQQMRKRQESFKRRSNTLPEIPSGSKAHQHRMLSQTPQAWPGETPEDVAVFDDSVLQTLSPELADQTAAVRDALKWACESRGEDALKCTASIRRSSPYSEWRLFVRGLVCWLNNDPPSASETWGRLDPERRPGRIATAMMNALNPLLEGPEGAPASSEAWLTEWTGRLDTATRDHAKLLRQVRFDRPAIKLAQVGLRIPDESAELRIGPRKLGWLRRFVAEYRGAEPELVAALQQVALRRAFAQDYVDLFEDATKAFEGPPHDRGNLLLSYFCFSQYDESRAQQRAEGYLQRYLKEDLPQNEALSAPLRAAIASQIHLAEACTLTQPKAGGFLPFMFRPSENAQEIRKHLNASVKAYPANRAAYKQHVEWIESKLEDERLTQKMGKPLIEELAQVMENWSHSLPEDSKPRLWLIDYLLENEQLEQAKPHVDWLAASRQDIPRVRAAPWKWQLLEAMRLCRRKAWLCEAPARLEEAEKLWPVWLSRDWLPYLKAAISLRAGRRHEFEAARESHWQAFEGARGSLTDACMTLGAAQLMRVAANDLKPLRAPVDEAVKNLRAVSDDDLFRISGFFWDLHRAQLLYPAYRMHGKKIANEISAQLREEPSRVLEHLDDAQVHSAVLLCSEHRCFEQNYDLKLPHWFSHPAVRKQPKFVAAQVNAILKLRYKWGAKKYADLGPFLREAAKSERDVYYRYWFTWLAEEFEEVFRREAAQPFGFGFNAFNAMFGEDADDADDADDLPFDPDCDCPTCQAARRAYAASNVFQ